MFCVNLLAERKAVDSVPKYSLLPGDTKRLLFFFLHNLQMSKQHRLINLTISYQEGPNLEFENSSFFISFIIWQKLKSPSQSNIQNPSFQSLCTLGK